MKTKDINFTIDDFRFNFRVAGWVECDNKVLLHKSSIGEYWNLPGGRIKFGENTNQTIIREMKEELDLNIKNAKLIHIGESLFEFNEKQVNELVFVYKIKIDKSHKLFSKQDFCTLDTPDEINHWFDKSEIKNIVCKPELIYKLASLKNDELSHSIYNNTNKNRK